ncbi:hypothetical protein GCM10025880_16640 [Methylorubrum aminovorans]|nr:hypothetical protein GCM10025880_16640 [Methylorubrum aminovorans]
MARHGPALSGEEAAVKAGHVGARHEIAEEVAPNHRVGRQAAQASRGAIAGEHSPGGVESENAHADFIPLLGGERVEIDRKVDRTIIRSPGVHLRRIDHYGSRYAFRARVTQCRGACSHSFEITETSHQVPEKPKLCLNAYRRRDTVRKPRRATAARAAARSEKRSQQSPTRPPHRSARSDRAVSSPSSRVGW